MADFAAADSSDNTASVERQTGETSLSSANMVSVRFDTSTLTTEESSERLPELQNGELSNAVNRPKKSLFEITSVVNTENDFVRGDSHGTDFDSELDDTFNESSKASTPIDLSSSADSQTLNNATSRFRIVKILRTEPYKKGRWQCQDMLNSENKQSEATKANSRATSPSTNVHGESQATEPTTNNSRHSSVGSEKSTRAPERGGDENGGTWSQSQAVQSDAGVSRTAFHNDADHNGPNRRYSNESSHSALEHPAPLPAVQPMVNTIETALDQISAIKSTLLSAFNNQVPTLKQTITTLSDENIMLREENYRLKQALMHERRGQTGDRSNSAHPGKS